MYALFKGCLLQKPIGLLYHIYKLLCYFIPLVNEGFFPPWKFGSKPEVGKFLPSIGGTGILWALTSMLGINTNKKISNIIDKSIIIHSAMQVTFYKIRVKYAED